MPVAMKVSMSVTASYSSARSASRASNASRTAPRRRASTAADSAAAIRESFASTRAMGDGAVVEEDGRIGARARGAAGSSPAIHTLALAHEFATMTELPRGALSSSASSQ